MHPLRTSLSHFSNRNLPASSNNDALACFSARLSPFDPFPYSILAARSQGSRPAPVSLCLLHNSPLISPSSLAPLQFHSALTSDSSRLDSATVPAFALYKISYHIESQRLAERAQCGGLGALRHWLALGDTYHVFFTRRKVRIGGTLISLVCCSNLDLLLDLFCSRSACYRTSARCM